MENRLKINARNARYRKKLRFRILSHYSAGNPECNCCGETEIKFLSVDHINNDGAKLRVGGKRLGGHRLVSWILSHNFPPGFQVLCYNCNCAKGFYGRCPHDIK